MTRSNCSPGDRMATQQISRYVDFLLLLPEPPETFVAGDLPEDVHSELRTLVEDGVIEQVRMEQYDNDSKCKDDRWVYKMSNWVPRKLETAANNRRTFLPCGHAGLVNKGDHYVCGFEPCSEQFYQDELEAEK